MKIHLTTAAILIATLSTAIAQTPYDSFAPEAKREMLGKPLPTFELFNTDSCSKVKRIALNMERKTMTYYGKNDSALQVVALSGVDYKWLSVDPKASKYPGASPYNFVNNNPIRNIDPDGQDWFSYQKEGAKEKSWNWHEGSEYKMKTGVDDQGADVFSTLQGQKAVIVFNGSKNEKLGEGQNLFGKGAVLASVTVYGPKGADDVQQYQGFTMTSDANKFGAIADGTYNFNYDAKGKGGKLKSNWAVEGREAVPAYGGYNPNPNYTGSDRSIKTGIFIHTSNQDGSAGKYNNGQNGISEGCLLIVPTQYTIFNQQLQGVQNGLLQLNRK